jgi:PAP2 superfamily C-terminal
MTLGSSSARVWMARAMVAAVGTGAWFWTQRRIARRRAPSDGIGDRLLDLAAPLNGILRRHPVWADRVLIATSALIDLLGLFLIGSAVFGPTIRPLLGLLLLFAMRQACQGLCTLPTPAGMIWREPGFPSLFVTYATASDLFFSGHTAIAVYGALELARQGGFALGTAGAAVAIVEIAAVLALRAHYTMDVFAGAVTALWAGTAASVLAPGLDAVIGSLLGVT